MCKKRLSGFKSSKLGTPFYKIWIGDQEIDHQNNNKITFVTSLDVHKKKFVVTTSILPLVHITLFSDQSFQ
jgi:hypothetical protein